MKASNHNFLTTRHEGALAESFKMSHLPAQQYHDGLDIQSCSLLKRMLVSPAHYVAPFFQGRGDDTPSMEFGRLIHCLVLEPHMFAAEYAVFSGKLDKRDKGFKAFALANSGKAVVDDCALREARTLADRILNKVIRGRPFGDYVAEGEPEASIYYTDPITGVRCRTRLDLRHPEFIFDLKTTIHPGQKEWVRQAVGLDYDMQAYMYSLADCLFTGREAALPFIFVAAESSAPYSVSAYTAGETFMSEGARKYKDALTGYAACSAVDHWPDASVEATIELDHWQVNQSVPGWRDGLAALA